MTTDSPTPSRQPQTSPKPRIDLDNIQIASPCSADWESMAGDERTRYCGDCSLHVHDISAMSADEAEQFLRDSSSANGRVCVRLHRRADGRVMTQDCPVGLRAVLARARRTKRRATLLAMSFLGMLTGACGLRSRPPVVEVGEIPQVPASVPAEKPSRNVDEPLEILGEIDPACGVDGLQTPKKAPTMLMGAMVHPEFLQGHESGEPLNERTADEGESPSDDRD